MKGTDKSADIKHKYDNIISLPYPREEIEADFPNPVLRAAQFAPFEALTGHEDEITETARATDKRRHLDEYAADVLEARIRFLIQKESESPEISVTYFIPDSKKNGGRYETHQGHFLKIKEYERLLILTDGREIPTADILELSGRIFDITD